MSTLEKSKVYFVQTGCVFNNEYYLPYTAGVIAAYAFNNQKIATSYELADIIYKCEDFNATLNNFKNPSVVAFSNYMWNCDFNLDLAQKIKQRFPECIIIFGGHQISNPTEWLEKYSFIDFAIFGEGETIFSEILINLCTKKEYSTIPNIAYRCNSQIVETKKKNICENINNFPSPYTSGIFDKIIQKNSSDSFAAIVETSRGCPYHCAYCDWGNYELPVRQFSVERIKKEIEWISKNSIVFVTIADSNFGLFESDEEIIDEFVRAKKAYGYPVAVETAFAKHNPERVFSMNKKLFDNNMTRGATLSMQSLSPQALKNIGRKNITTEKFSQLIRLYAESNIPSYTELILGLPGETYESFCEGIDTLLELGQHNSIHVFCCEILPNAIMGQKEYQEKHKIEILERDFNLRNGMQNAGIKGRSQIIVGTETMNKKMFLKSILYAFTIQVFHNFGLCRIISLYLHHEKGIKYHQFYKHLIDWLIDNPQSYTGNIFNRFAEKYRLFLNGECSDTYRNNIFGTTQFNLSDGAFLEIVRHCENFYDEVSSFVAMFSMDNETFSELIRFQKAIIRKPSNPKICENFSYNWVEYYMNLIKFGKGTLRKEHIEFTVFPSDEYNDLISYSEAIAIKGRRTGRSIVLNTPNGFTVRTIIN
ncbi:MAG: B12-binding domain-containing radical SAM protein [Ruminococcaceae bacterium]|nr:B12-binding domain-containing radical SAM protein [Oscillospiraceae bacterium]